MTQLDFITMCDGYKLDHRRQYPAGTEFVYSNFTPRSSRTGEDKVVFFGLQYFLQAYLMESAEQTFFSRPLDEVIGKYRRFTESYLGPNDIGSDHIEALHSLGYIPLQFWALPEGTRVPLRIPMFTYENTHHEFFWVTNYIETILSAVLWLPCTSATTANVYRRILDNFAEITGGAKEFVPWQGHDFSFRGMGGLEAAALSGAGHLLSFTGTDSIPAIQLLQKYYDADGLIGGSVAATEHSVMCAGGCDGETETFSRLLDLYPRGVVSVVSDTWDLWNVIENILPSLKDKIEARDGKLVIRPDSGDPVKILCGDPDATGPASSGVIELLWNIFGGSWTDDNFRVLSPKIGAIYGDSITPERCYAICDRLCDKGFASTNVVFGIGSYTYQYVTRDTYGFAVKATQTQRNSTEYQMFKAPKTDNGVKNSARGRIAVINDNGALRMIDNLRAGDTQLDFMGNLLRPIWRDGAFIKRTSLAEIRDRLREQQ